MKHIPAHVYNALTYEERLDPFRYWEFVGLNVSRPFKNFKGNLTNKLTVTVFRKEVRFTFTSDHDDNYSLDEVKRMIELLS